MADRTQKQTHGTLGDIKTAVKGVKGAGDAIRGTFNESIDTAFHQREGEAKNKAIKEKGIADLERTDAHFNKNQHVGATAGTGQPVTSTTQPDTRPTHVASGMSHSTTGATHPYTEATTHSTTGTAHPAIGATHPHTGATTNPNDGSTDVPVDQHHAVGSQGVGTAGKVTGGLARNTQLPDGTSTGAGAHSGGVGNMQSNVPTQGLGGEPAGARDQY